MATNSVSLTIPLGTLEQALYDGIENWLVNSRKDDWDGDVLTIDFGVDSEEWYPFQKEGVEHILKDLLDR